MKPTNQEAGANYAFIADATREQLGVFATAIFERIGYFTSPGEGLTVHGINYIVYKPDLSEPEIALRCRPDTGEVNACDVSSFWTKITTQGYGRGIFVTNQSFSSSAQAFAEQRDLLLVDAGGLESGLRSLPDNHRDKVLEIVEPIKKATVTPTTKAPATEEPITFGTPVLNTQTPEVSEAPEIADTGDADTEADTFSPFTREDVDLEEWLPEPEFKKGGNSSSSAYETDWQDAKKDSGATMMVAALLPVTLILAGVLVWEPLMGGGGEASSDDASFVNPVVSQYLEEGEMGADFQEVAEMVRAPRPGPTIQQ